MISMVIVQCTTSLILVPQMRVHQALVRQLLLLFVLFYLTADAAKGNGANKKSAGRIIGGKIVENAKYPFVVSIQLTRSKGWMHHCGGSIISPTAILTACHCVVVGVSWDPPKLLNPSIARVVAGVVDLTDQSRDKQVRRVQKVEAHPKCSNKPYYLSYDVGAYILKDPLQYTHSVQPLKITSNCPDDATRDLSILAKKGAVCFSPGWGTTKTPGYFPSKVMKVATLQLFTTKQCQKFFCERTKNYCNINYFDAKQICAAGSDSTDCNGDSGGPLICNGYVFGTVSWRVRCEFGWPHVFTNIIPILDVVKKYGSNHDNKTCSWRAPNRWHRLSGWN